MSIILYMADGRSRTKSTEQGRRAREHLMGARINLHVKKYGRVRTPGTVSFIAHHHAIYRSTESTFKITILNSKRLRFDVDLGLFAGAHVAARIESENVGVSERRNSSCGTDRK